MENRFIDVRTVSETGPEIRFQATPAERQELEKRFCIPELYDLSVTGTFSYRDDLISFQGMMKSRAKRICGITLKPFTESAEYPLDLLFSQNPDKEKDDLSTDIFPISRGKIDLFATFSELLGLNLNPFPKSVNDYLDYQDPTDEKAENPFSVLKKLKKGGNS